MHGLSSLFSVFACYTVYLYNTKSAQSIGKVDLPDKGTCLLRGSSNDFFVGCSDGSVQRYKVKNAKFVNAFPQDASETTGDAVVTIRLSNKRTHLFVGHASGKVALYLSNKSKASTIATFNHGSEIKDIAVEGHVLITAGADGSIKAWKWEDASGAVKDPSLVFAPGHEGSYAESLLAVSDSLLVSGGNDGSVAFWSLASGARLSSINAGANPGHQGAVVSLLTNGTKALFTASRDSNVIEWDISSVIKGAETLAAAVRKGDKGTATPEVSAPTQSVVFSGHSSQVMDMAWDSGVLYTTSNKEVVGTVTIAGDATTRSWSKTGKALKTYTARAVPITRFGVTSDQRIVGVGLKEPATLFEQSIETGVITEPLAEKLAGVTVLWVKVVGDHVYVGTSSKGAECWKPTAGAWQLICLYTLSDNGPGVVVFPLSGFQTTIVGSKAVLESFNRVTGGAVAAFDISTLGPVSAGCAHPVNRTEFVTGHLSGDLALWRADTGEMTTKILGHTREVMDVVFVSPDPEPESEAAGQIVSCSRDRFIKRWTSRGECLYTYRGHEGYVNSVAVYGDVLYSGSSDKTLKMWDLKDNACKRTLSDHSDSLKWLTPHEETLFTSSSQYVTYNMDWMNDYGVIEKHRPLTENRLDASLARWSSMSEYIFMMALVLVEFAQLASFAFTNPDLWENKTVADTLAFVRQFGLNFLTYQFALYAAIGLSGLFMVLVYLQEAVEYAKFVNPDRGSTKYFWLFLSAFTKFASRPAFLPVFLVLTQVIDCRSDGAGGFVLAEDESVTCYDDDWYVFAGLAVGFGVPYVLFCLRLMRVGGQLENIEVKLNPFDWSGDSFIASYDHGFSVGPPGTTYALVVVIIKIVLTIATLAVDRDRLEDVAQYIILVGVSLAAAILAYKYNPFYGEGANMTRTGLDSALALTYVTGLILVLLDDPEQKGLVETIWLYSVLPLSFLAAYGRRVQIRNKVAKSLEAENITAAAEDARAQRAALLDSKSPPASPATPASPSPPAGAEPVEPVAREDLPVPGKSEKKGKKKRRKSGSKRKE